METLPPRGIINQDEKQLFRLDVRSGEDINKKYTAHELKVLISANLTDKDIKVMEVRYNISKTAEVSKFEENIRNKRPPEIQAGFNRINTAPFDLLVFRDLQPLNKKEHIEEKVNRELKVQTEREIKESIDQIDKALDKVMKTYLADKPDMVTANKAALMEVSKQNQKVRISVVVLTHPKTYEDFKNVKITVKGVNGDAILYLDHPKGNKEIDKEEATKIRQCYPIEYFRFGCFDEVGGTFAPYFDMKDFEKRLRNTNTSIKLSCSIMRENQEKVKRFDLYVDMFEKIGLKAEVQVAQIDKVTRYARPDRGFSYFLKLKYPVRWNLNQIDINVFQETSFVRDWRRVENFPILRNPQIKENEFSRLHLINNTVIEIAIGGDEHKRGQKFLEDLFIKFNLQPVDKVIGPMSFERFRTKLQGQTNKFKDNLHLTPIAKHLIWKIKYYILALVSKNYLRAEHVNSLIKLIQDNANQTHVFLHLFEKMCIQEQAWDIQTIANKLEDRKSWPINLLKSYTDPSGEAVYVWRVNITPSGYMYSNKAPEMRNRLLREYSNEIDHFIRCNIIDDNGQPLKNNSYVTRGIFRTMLNEIRVEDYHFIPLGWSPSQLRKFSLWYVHEHGDLKRSQILNFLGDFCKIEPFAKMAARIGQAFSSSWCYEFTTKPKVETIPDIYVEGTTMLFTDGIGKISEDLMDKISLRLRIPNLSVIQIRYKGAKGLLTLDPTLPANTIQLRPSMVKYDCKHINSDKYLDILSWNMYKGGYLNRQIIILLRTLGVQDEQFMTLQSTYIENIKKMSYRECTIYRQLTDPEGDQALYNLEPANKIIRNLCQTGFELDKEPFFIGILKILKRNGYQKLQEKSNINVDKAARLVGVIDQHQVIEEGEVYCCIDNPFPDDNEDTKKIPNKFLFQESKPQTVTGIVFVVRNPCVHPGDVRKLRCISEEDIISRFRAKKLIGEKNKHPFSRFTNTVIFSQKGKRPVTCEISGSDLDGDNFFICWDESLLPVDTCEPHIIQDAHKEKKTKDSTSTNKTEVNAKDYVEMLEFFVDYMNYDKLGKIANSHLVTADKDLTNYAHNSDCIKLAIAHGNAVDFPKSGYCPPIDEKLFVKDYPDFMEKGDEFSGKTYISKSVMGKLYRDIKAKMETLIDKDGEKEPDVCLDDELCTPRPTLNFSEEEIKEALLIIRNFNEDLDSIIYLFGLFNEFEVYSGNITSSKGKIAKQSKPLEHIVALKTTYTKIFFDEKTDMNSTEYFASERTKLNGKFFSEWIQSKAMLWYVLSYSEFFEDLKYSDMNALSNFRVVVERVKQSCGTRDIKTKFIGLVWFTIPKVLMDIKIRGVRNKIKPEVGNNGGKSEEVDEELD